MLLIPVRGPVVTPGSRPMFGHLRLGARRAVETNELFRPVPAVAADLLA